MKDILGREVQFGDLVLAHNVKWTNSKFMGYRNYALYVGDNYCFTLVDDYNYFDNYYMYQYKCDYCFLIKNISESEKPILSRFIMAYDLFKQGKRNCTKLSLK